MSCKAKAFITPWLLSILKNMCPIMWPTGLNLIYPCLRVSWWLLFEFFWLLPKYHSLYWKISKKIVSMSNVEWIILQVAKVSFHFCVHFHFYQILCQHHIIWFSLWSLFCHCLLQNGILLSLKWLWSGNLWI